MHASLPGEMWLGEAPTWLPNADSVSLQTFKQGSTLTSSDITCTQPCFRFARENIGSHPSHAAQVSHLTVIDFQLCTAVAGRLQQSLTIPRP